MSSTFRNRFVQSIVCDIELLSGGQFEQFAYRVLDAVYPPHSGAWAERGTTIPGAPRGFTVDASADGAQTVAEVSSEADYFGSSASKPSRDILHAIGTHPSASRIILLSSREAPPGAATAIDNLISSTKLAHPSLRSIDTLDSRAIATRIFDLLDSDLAIRSLSTYLPSLKALGDEYAISHQVPTYPNYIPRPDLESIITQRLESHGKVHIAGLSGAGKTAIASRVAQSLQSSFDSVFWIPGDIAKRVEDLGDLDIRRNGVHHNLLAALRRRNCLLIVDDLQFPWSALSAAIPTNSRVIATSQIAEDSDSVVVGDVCSETAISIITQGVATPPPPELSLSLATSVGGHALLLSIMNRLAQHEGWDAALACLDTAPASLEDDRHQKICQRILRHHTASLSKELAFVRWCDTPIIDLELAHICVSPRFEANMMRRAFLSATPTGIARVHSVVYAAIVAESHTSPHQDLGFASALKAHIRSECHSERPTIQRVANVHEALMTRLAHADNCAELVYVMALARYSGCDASLLDAWLRSAVQIASTPYSDHREIEFRATIEAIEAAYTLTSNTQGKDAARSQLTANILVFDTLASTPLVPGRIHRDIRHHRAKMLTRLGRLSEAERELRELLAQDHSACATRLQLARLLDQTGEHDAAIQEAEAICTQHQDGLVRASPRVILEALRIIAAGHSTERVLMYQQLMHETIAVLDYTVWQWSVELLAAVAQKLWFSAPNVVNSLFSSVDWESVIPRSDRDRFDWAQAYKYAAQASQDRPERDRLLSASIEHYREIKSPNDYHLVNYGECAILCGSATESLSALGRVSNSGRNDFWDYRQSQALLLAGDATAAHKAASSAIDRCKDQKYLPSRLALRHDALMAMQRPEDAKADLVRAIAMLPDTDKYGHELRNRLSSLHGST